MPERTCPQCGNELVFKHGIYGQFIGCSNYPACTFTMNEDGTPTKWQKEVDEWDEHGKPTSYGYTPIIKAKTKTRCPYNTCDGSGFLPFIGKDGKPRNDVHIFCDCHDEYANPYPCELKPSDIDYSVSYSYYRSLCQQHGWQDLGSDYPDEPVREHQPFVPRPIVNVTYKVNEMQTPAFKSLQEQISLLKGRLTKYFEAKKKREQKYGYKGIR